jgi:hypothetical protein
MIPTFPIELMATVAPFAYGAAGFVLACLGVILVKAIRAESADTSAPTRVISGEDSRSSIAA